MDKKSNYWLIKSALLISISILFSNQSFAQIKSYKAQYNFDYLNLDIGVGYVGYYGIGYRKSIIGNLGLHGVLGISTPNSSNKLLKREASSGTCNSCSRFIDPLPFLDGISLGLSLSYVIPITGNKFGIVPNLGFLYENNTFIRGVYLSTPREFNVYSEMESSVNFGLDFYIKKFIVGFNYTPWTARSTFRIGYVVNDKMKNVKF